MKLGKIIYKGKTKKGRDIIIRYPHKTDSKMMLDYINTLSRERTYIRFQGEQQTLEEEEMYMSNFLKKIEIDQAIKLLAFSGDILIGVTDISLEDKTSSHVGLFGITVAKEYRGEGVGKLLMRLVHEEAGKNIKDLRIVRLSCFANNKLACLMYKNFGFEEYGTLPKGIKYKEDYVDHIYMYKNIKNEI